MHGDCLDYVNKHLGKNVYLETLIESFRDTEDNAYENSSLPTVEEQAHCALLIL